MYDGKLTISLENIISNPKCSHGPMLLFCKGEKEYYACSAFRDRKLCSSYVEKDKFFRNAKKYGKKIKDESRTHIKQYNDTKQLKKKKSTFEYCKLCETIVTDVNDHKTHDLIRNLGTSQLKAPSTFLPPKQNRKSNAQFFFSVQTLDKILKLIINSKFTHILCIGTPTVFEQLQKKRKHGINSFLLDLDDRFYRFHSTKHFSRFNIFNNYFFAKNDRKHFEMFLQSLQEPKKTAIILDPPFGGRTEPIFKSLNEIQNLYQKINCDVNQLSPIVFWIFPYFMEKFLKESDENYQMLPIKIEYQNHKKFRNTHGKNGSPIRIFANCDQSDLNFKGIGEKYCSVCDQFVFENSQHCMECGKCCLGNGSMYRHCSKCGKCVKTTWKHCISCEFCHLENVCNRD